MAFLLPAIGAAAAAGVGVKVYKDNEFKKIKCQDDYVFYKGSCEPCIGGSSTNFDGPDAMPLKGCRCDSESGWDAKLKRCVKCPTGFVPEFTGNESNVPGCGCKSEQRFDSITKTCVTCPTGTYGIPAFSENLTNIAGCYCPDGSTWNSTTNVCVGCLNIDLLGNKGPKDGQCVNCPTASNQFSTYGADTSIHGCKCNNGYILKNGVCEACPSNYISRNNKCCPRGSDPFSPGSEVISGCYCMPYHTFVSGECQYTYGSNAYSSDKIVVTGRDANESISTDITLATSPAADRADTGGIVGIDAIAIQTNKDLGHTIFIKQVTIQYNSAAATSELTPYVLPNTRDLLCEDDLTSPYIQSIDAVDKTKYIKRVIIDVIHSYYSTSYRPLELYIRFIGLSVAGAITIDKKYKIPLPTTGDNRKITLDLAAA